MISVQLAGADAQETKLQVNGAAEVSTDGNCNYVLRLPKLSVTGPDGKRSAELSELQLSKPVKFVLADQLEPEVCTEQDESPFGLNVKRAIISLLQSNLESGTETESDVFGLCQTTNLATTTGDNVQVVRSRDLNACINRESFHTGLVTSIADQSAGLSTTPLLSGDASNEQTIKAGIVEKAQLTENYKFVPFAVGEAGVRAKVVTKINLKSKAAGKIDAPKATVPRQLTFENPAPVPQKKAIDSALKSTLVAAVEQLNGAVGSTAAGKFSELVHLLRTVSKEDLLVLYKGTDSGTVHPNKQLARSVFLDALFRAGTSESVEAVAGLQKELNDREKHLAYLSFNLVENVEKEALPAINKLLDEKPTNDAYLSIGNLIHKYVRSHPAESELPIKALLKKFNNKLGADCKQDAKRENTIVAVLKGLRNTQHLINPDLTISCTGAHQTQRVRVAALQTLTAAACNLKTQQAALQLLQNRELDSELRIEAYLTFVSCPSATVANEVKSLLDEETSLQVGSFITTHLAALRSSTDPYRETARQHFANVRTTKKFPSDVRQYSFNHEYSYSLGSLGVGASADARLIYSQDDFVPRSGRLNVTGQLFGESFNVFDISARQENIDLVLEHNFGPKGLFNRLSHQELYDFFTATLEKPKPNRRGRRGLRPDVEALKKEERSGLGDIELDISIKLFGNELYFLSLSDKLPLDPKEFVKRLQHNIGKLVTNAKDFKETFEHRSLFLDAELVYPTGVGFPLRLVAHGSGGIRLDVAGKLPLEANAKNPSALAFTIKTVPSYNVEVSGTLQVDGFSVSTGFAVTGSVHSSTGAEVDFKLLGQNSGFDTKFRFPLKKQQLFTFAHDIVTVTQERGHASFSTPLKFTSKDQKFTGCFDQLNSFVGVTVCSDVSVTIPGTPNTALFPLNGPNFGSVWIEIEPEYVFNGRYSVANQGEHTVALEFDTPGSANSRKLTVTLGAAFTPKIFARLSVKHEKYEANAKAGLINEPNEVAVYAEHESTNRKFLAKLGFTKAGSGKHFVYTPIAVYQLDSKTEDNINGWKVTGTVTSDQPSDNHIIFKFNDVKLIGPHIEPIAVNGQAEHDSGRFSTDVTLSQGSHSGNIKAAIRPDSKHFELEAAVTNNVVDYINGKFALDCERSDSHVSC